jgi:hypothetical protein
MKWLLWLGLFAGLFLIAWIAIRIYSPKDPTYAWTYDPACTLSSAGKPITQNAICMDTVYGNRVNDTLCKEEKPPPRNTTCPMYTWNLDELPECNVENAGQTVKQPISCKDSSGQIVSDYYCNGYPKPYVKIKKCPTYSWRVSETLCTNKNVGENTPNQIKCVDSNGETVNETFCTLKDKPVETTTNCPFYEWKVTKELPVCNVDNQNQTYTQKIECYDENGNVVSKYNCPQDSKPVAQTITCPWYTWERFNDCNEGNAGKIIDQTVRCVNAITKAPVDDSFCPAQYKPEVNKVQCPNYVWGFTDLPECGLDDDGKTLSQSIICIDKVNDVVVSDSKCDQNKKIPLESRKQKLVCPVKDYVWISEFNKPVCGETNKGKKYTGKVYCLAINPETNDQFPVPDKYCDPSKKPPVEEEICPNYVWRVFADTCPTGPQGGAGPVIAEDIISCYEYTTQTIVSSELCDPCSKPTPKKFECDSFVWKTIKPICSYNFINENGQSVNTSNKSVSGEVVCVNNRSGIVYPDDYCMASNKPAIPKTTCPAIFSGQWYIEPCTDATVGIEREYKCLPANPDAGYTLSEDLCRGDKPPSETCYGYWAIPSDWVVPLHEFNNYLDTYDLTTECYGPSSNKKTTEDKCIPYLAYKEIIYKNKLSLQSLNYYVDKMDIVNNSYDKEGENTFYVVVPQIISTPTPDPNDEVGVTINDIVYKPLKSWTKVQLTEYIRKTQQQYDETVDVAEKKIYKNALDEVNDVKYRSNIIRNSKTVDNYEVFKLEGLYPSKYNELINGINNIYPPMPQILFNWFPTSAWTYRFQKSDIYDYSPPNEGCFKYINYIDKDRVSNPIILLSKTSHNKMKLDKRLKETVLVFKEIKDAFFIPLILNSDGIYNNLAEANINSKDKKGYYPKIGDSFTYIEKEQRTSVDYFSYSFRYYSFPFKDVIFDDKYTFVVEIYNNISFLKPA